MVRSTDDGGAVSTQRSAQTRGTGWVPHAPASAATAAGHRGLASAPTSQAHVPGGKADIVCGGTMEQPGVYTMHDDGSGLE